MTPEAAEPRRTVLLNRWIGAAVATVALGLLAVLAVRLHGTRNPTGFDSAVNDWLQSHTGAGAARALLWPSEPVLTLGLVIVVTVVAALRRRPGLAAVGAIGPAAAVLLEDRVLKPSIDRLFGLVEVLSRGVVAAGYGFPSGHETALVASATLLGLALLRSAWSRRTRTVGVVLLVVWTVLGAAGLVRNDYHYATDTVGGALLGLGVVVLAAVLVDSALALVAAPGRVSSPAARARPRSRHAA